MIRTLVKVLVNLVEAKLEKSGIEQAILKNQNYMAVGKQIWREIDETYRISQSIDEKIQSKADMFEVKVLARFPELSKEDIDCLRLAIGGEVNQGKAAVLDNSTIIKELQENIAKITAENASLKDVISKIQTATTNNITTPSNS